MADNAAILAAQAEAGQAGVSAYQQAQAEIERRRREAIAQAIQEAQLRGASPEAAQAAAVGVGDASNDRLGSLAQDSATYQADLARRAGRMNDYSAAVQSARGLLGEQVGLAVAPINAQSAADVAKIEAQTKAQLALAQAQAARGGGGRGGGGGGGGRKTSYSQTEARSVMAQAAAQRINETTGQLNTAVQKASQQYSATPAAPRVQATANAPGADRAPVSFREESLAYRAANPQGFTPLSDMWAIAGQANAANPGAAINPSIIANQAYQGLGKLPDYTKVPAVRRPGDPTYMKDAQAERLAAAQNQALRQAMQSAAGFQQTLGNWTRTTLPTAISRGNALSGAQEALSGFNTKRSDPQFFRDMMVMEGAKLGIPDDVMAAAIGTEYQPGMSVEDYIAKMQGGLTPSEARAQRNDELSTAKNEAEAKRDAIMASPAATQDWQGLGGATVGDVVNGAGISVEQASKVITNKTFQQAMDALTGLVYTDGKKPADALKELTQSDSKEIASIARDPVVRKVLLWGASA